MWLAASSFAVPDGVLATLATAQLNGKPHQGVLAKNLASPPGIGECNSTAAIGLRASLALNSLRQSERARYYGSALGRFTSPDWSARPQPVPYANFRNPQSLNLYLYMQNNPLSGTDPDGHCCDWNDVRQFGSGFADTTYRPIVQAVSHPLDTGSALLHAASHPLDTAVAIKNAAVDTGKAALSGDPNALGKVTGTVVSALATAGAGKVASALVEGAEVGEATSLFRAVGSAEADSIGSTGAFSASPTGSEFKGFFYSESDAQGFGARMTQMTGDPHTVVSADAPTGLVNASPVHNAATEGQGVLIRNENLPQVKLKQPNQ